jgi:hypothetical protein
LGKMKRVSQRLLMGATCVGGAWVLYLLSLGPVLRLTTDTRFEGAAETMYAPVLDRAAWPAVRWYLRAWGLYHSIADPPNLPRPK